MASSSTVEVSGREAQVLDSLGADLSNAQIARRLHISVRTVEWHVSSLLRKYGVADRRALAALATAAPTGAPAPGHLPGLPAQRTMLVGRAAERDAVLAALADCQLVTLLGPGGVGKTRLSAGVAAAAAPSFPFGGAFVDLVPVRGDFFSQAVASALDVSEQPNQPLTDAIVDRLGRGRSLLVLDNCDHLLDEVAGLAERVAAACPQTRILVTSRERLRVPGERTIPVAPLPAADAEALFRDRAGAVDPDRTVAAATVADLCARLDGLPLAIELAAARSASLGASGLLTGLEDYLRLLAGGRGADVRHRSLRAVLDWSHDLLDDEERTLFRQLATFAGGFDVHAVLAVASQSNARGGAVADVLGRLVDKSLVVHEPPGRWRLLDTVRAYAAQRLRTGGDATAVRDRYTAWAAAAATALETRLGEDGWREDFDAVAADLRAALAGAPPGPGPLPHRLARSLGHLSYARGFLLAAMGHYRSAAGHAPTHRDAAGDLLSTADCAAVCTGGPEHLDLLLAAADRARAGGDGNTQAIALARAVEMAVRHPARFPTPVPHERLYALVDQAVAAGDPDDPVVAAHLAIVRALSATPDWDVDVDPTLAEQAAAAARRTGDPVLLSAALDLAVFATAAAGGLRRAYQISRGRLDLLPMLDRTHPSACLEIDDIYGTASMHAIGTGDLTGALTTARMAGDDDLYGSHTIHVPRLHAVPLVLLGALDEGLAQATRMWDAWQRSGRPFAGQLVPAVSLAALACGLRGDQAGLHRWRARVAEVAGDAPAHLHRLSSLAFLDIRMAIHTGDLATARPLVDRAFGGLYAHGSLSVSQSAAAELAVVAGLPDAAERVAAMAPVAAESDWAAACVARATGRLHGDPEALASSVEGWERIGARVERACTLLLLPDRAAEGRAELAALGVTEPCLR